MAHENSSKRAEAGSPETNRQFPSQACAAATGLARPWVATSTRGLAPETCQQLLAALLSSRSFDEACMAAGVSRGEALLARVRDPAFARLWDETVEVRLSEVTARLTDLAIGGLQRGLEPGEDARAAIALGQWLVEGRRTAVKKRATTEKAGAARGEADTDSPTDAGTADQPEDTARQIEELFAIIEQRIHAAEALQAAAGN